MINNYYDTHKNMESKYLTLKYGLEGGGGGVNASVSKDQGSKYPQCVRPQNPTMINLQLHPHAHNEVSYPDPTPKRRST